MKGASRDSAFKRSWCSMSVPQTVAKPPEQCRGRLKSVESRQLCLEILRVTSLTWYSSCSVRPLCEHRPPPGEHATQRHHSRARQECGLFGHACGGQTDGGDTVLHATSLRFWFLGKGFLRISIYVSPGRLKLLYAYLWLRYAHPRAFMLWLGRQYDTSAAVHNVHPVHHVHNSRKAAKPRAT